MNDSIIGVVLGVMLGSMLQKKFDIVGKTVKAYKKYQLAQKNKRIQTKLNLHKHGPQCNDGPCKE